MVAINKVFLAISSVQLLERIQSVFTKLQNEVTLAVEKKNLKLLFWLKLNFYFFIFERVTNNKTSGKVYGVWVHITRFPAIVRFLVFLRSLNKASAFQKAE